MTQEIWHPYLTRLLATRIVRYFCIGLITAIFDVGLYVILVSAVGWNYFWVGAGGFVLTTFLNYELGLRFVFTEPQHQRNRRSLLLVFLVSLAGLALHQACLYIGVTLIGAGTTGSKLSAIGIVFFWNYFARSLLIFRNA